MVVCLWRNNLRVREKTNIRITTTSQTMWTLIILALIPSLCAQEQEQPRTSYACEGSTMKITCPGDHVINVLRANYGRRHLSVCNEDQPVDGWVDDCIYPRSVRIVEELCQNKQSCWIPATNRMFGDPCNKTPKYLEVHYRCAKAEPTTTPKFQTRPPVTPSPTTTTSSTTTTVTTTRSISSTSTPTTHKSTQPSTQPTKPPVVSPKSCQGGYVRNITWPTTSARDTAFEICPNNRLEMAQWRCTAEGNWLGTPDLSRCKSPKITQLENQMANDEPVMDISHSMVEITEEDLFGGDVAELTKVMQELVQEIETEEYEDEMVINEVNEAILKSGSNLLDSKKNESWRDLPQSEQRNSATQLMNAVEESAELVAGCIHTAPQAPVINIEVNIVMQVTVVDTGGAVVKDVVFPEVDALKGSKWEKNKDSIRLTSGAVKEFSVEGLAKLIFLTYDNMNELLKPQRDRSFENEVHEAKGAAEETTYKVSDNGHAVDSKEDVDHSEVTPGQNNNDIVNIEGEVPVPSKEEQERKNKLQNKIVNSNIISATIAGKEPDDKGMIMLPPGEGVYYTLEHKTTNNVFNPTCSFWEYSEKTLDGQWSDFGCEVVDTNVTHTVCSCNHLTNFAVLMDVVGTELSSHHRLTLSLITYIGCIVSIICLILAWLTFQFCKNLQCDRNTIHKNLVLTLCLAETVFLVGIIQYDKPFLCSLIAGLLHYLFLAAFSWMCLEGVQLYVMLIEVFEAEKSRIKLYYLAAYGIPAIVVLISAAVDHTGYGTPEYCWLRIDNGFVWAFVGPALAVICVNFVMLSIAIYMMCKHASIAAQYKMKEKSRIDNIRSWLKGAFVLVVLLGLTWSFGLFYISEHTAVMAYLFTILNSLQGLFIFIFHCFMNEKVQKEYKRCIRHAGFLPDSVRIKYGGMKAYTSSSPHSSSSGGNYLQKLWSGRRRKRSSLTSLQRSSTPSTKCEYRHYPNVNSCQDTAGTPLSPDDRDRQVSNFSTEGCTEDPMGYLEPVKIRITDSYLDNDGINGDLSQIEGSVVDSDYLMDYGRKPLPPINVEKYKIKPNDTSRLSAISNDTKPGEFTESEFSDGELFRMTEKEKMLYSENEYEELPMAPPIPKTISEENLINKLNNDSTLKRNLNNESPSLNDLNKEGSDGSKSSLCLSTPNIKYKTDTMRSQDSNTARDSPMKRSLPNIASSSSADSSTQGTPLGTSPSAADPSMDKIKAALGADNGLINIYHGKTEDKRFSKDTENALKANHVRYSSSDC